MIVKFHSIFLFLLLASFCGKTVKGKPKRISGRLSLKQSQITTKTDVYKFLDKFGYNKCSRYRNETTGIRSRGPPCQISLQSMLKYFQTVFGLPATGEVDDETINLMNRPRCGLGDYPSAYVAFRPW